MKKNRLSLALAIIAALAGITACKKNTNTTTPPTTVSDPYPLSTLFANLRTTPQNFDVPAGVHKTIIGKDSTIISFYPNSFKDKSGNIITSGTINIKLVEMYKPGQIIANRASTMVKGQLLKSGGEIYIKATRGGEEVFANKYQVYFKQPATSSEPMYLFHEALPADSAIVKWEIEDTSRQKESGTIATAAVVPDSIQTGDTVFTWAGSPFYKFDSCSKFGWTNCDRFYMFTSKTGLGVVMPDNTFTPSNTQLFLVLPTINAVMSSDSYYLGGAHYDAPTRTLRLVSEGSAADLVPVGMPYKVVVVANKGGTYYYNESSGTTVAGMQLTAVMSAVSLNDLQNKIKAL
jgi:hypothetical protein